MSKLAEKIRRATRLQTARLGFGAARPSSEHTMVLAALTADPAALHWWTLFNCVKGQAIWVSSARAWIDGGNREPIMAYPPWALQNAQDRAALKVMGRL